MSVASQQFKNDAERLTHDLRHRSLIQTALKKYEVARDSKKSRYQDWQSARQTAAEIKWDAVNHLDTYLEEFASKLEARGAHVHWASTGEQARQIILGIVREKNARSIIKSKVMTGEEIHLNEALEKAGLTVVESDFGEVHCPTPARGTVSFCLSRNASRARRDQPAVRGEARL